MHKVAVGAADEVGQRPPGEVRGGDAITHIAARPGEPGSAVSDESEQARPNTRAKGKRNSGAEAATTNGRRKANDAPAKGPATKKAKMNGGPVNGNNMDIDHSDDDEDEDDDDKPSKDDHPKTKMTDEEKRKNFLERNRYGRWPLLLTE